MMNENELAKVICRAAIEKNLDALREAGTLPRVAGPALHVAVDREVSTGWQKFLPEARAVIKALG